MSPPATLAEPDSREQKHDEREDDQLDGQREPVGVMGDQPRDSTHRPPTV